MEVGWARIVGFDVFISLFVLSPPFDVLFCTVEELAIDRVTGRCIVDSDFEDVDDDDDCVDDDGCEDDDIGKDGGKGKGLTEG